MARKILERGPKPPVYGPFGPMGGNRIGDLDAVIASHDVITTLSRRDTGHDDADVTIVRSIVATVRSSRSTVQTD